MYPIQKSPKISRKFICEFCEYNCCKLSEYNKHLLTNKHKILQNPTHLNNQKTYKCICGKNYKHSSTLYAHKKKNNCQENIVSLANLIDDKLTINTNDGQQQLVEYLMKENSEFKQLMIDQNKHMMELAKHSGNNNSNVNINNTNSHNKTFNLNFFLNETCKNALNITDFIDSIKVSLDDLENTGRQGYIEGISSIILNKLKNLNHYDRPIHCADQKREILYIKNDNQWIKETEEKPLLTKAIKTIANENIKQIKKWRDKNPDCTASDSKKNNLYLKIVSNSMNGSTEAESDKNINKIISNVAKKTIIPKET
jgi:hypothetical protein